MSVVSSVVDAATSILENVASIFWYLQIAASRHEQHTIMVWPRTYANEA